MNFDVAVIGGGVSGLTTAHELMQRGYRVVVLERQVRAGGNAISERIGGFLMEHGPSSINGASEVTADLARAAGLDGQRCELASGVRYRYLADADGLNRISTHALGFILSSYLSLGARLRLLGEAFVPARRGEVEETVGEFCRRRFGHEFTERVIDPLVGGLYAGDAEEMSMDAAFPRLLAMERRHGSILRATVRSRLAGGRMPGKRLYSWRDGVGSLPRALAGRLGAAVRTGVAVRRIIAVPGGFRIEAGISGALSARAVVLATQPHIAAALLDGLDSQGAEAAAAIVAPPLSVVYLGYRRRQVDHPLDGLGYLTPSGAGRALSGALFCSTMFAGRAPEGHVSLAAYVGGARPPDPARMSEPDLIALARHEFGDLLGARGEPALARVRVWPRGLPQYRRGHVGLVDGLRTIAERMPGFYVTGNYLAGPSVASCVAQACNAAARVDADLQNETARSRPLFAARF